MEATLKNFPGPPPLRKGRKNSPAAKDGFAFPVFIEDGSRYVHADGRQLAEWCAEQKLAAVAEEIKTIVKKMDETGVELTCRHVTSRMEHPAFLRDARLVEVMQTAFSARR